MTGLSARPTELRVVLDTNVLVSALLTPAGNPSTILQATLDGDLTLVYSDAILTEYHSVLARPRFGFDRRDIAELLAFIEAFGESIDPQPSDVFMPDQDDRQFYDAGMAAKAMVVTGNVKHYPRSDLVITPADFVRSHLGSA